jgi:hypothetical protein
MSKLGGKTGKCVDKFGVKNVLGEHHVRSVASRSARYSLAQTAVHT